MVLTPEIDINTNFERSFVETSNRQNPCSLTRKQFTALLAARRLALQGLGERQKAKGALLIMGKADKLPNETDADRDFVFGAIGQDIFDFRSKL